MGEEMNPKKIRNSVVGLIGSDAAHAFQDAATVATTLTLAATYPPAALVILTALGGDSLRPRKLTGFVDRVVREEDAAENPEYFVVGLLVGGTVGTVAGTAAAAVLPRLSEVALFA